MVRVGSLHFSSLRSADISGWMVGPLLDMLVFLLKSQLDNSSNIITCLDLVNEVVGSS